MKTLKFESKLIPDILSGKKHSTWRLFDDKDLAKGDNLILVNKDTARDFGKAAVVDIRPVALDGISTDDIRSHGYKSKEEMYEAFKKYYGSRVKSTSIVKIIEFILT